ncbi:MAG: LysR family transcriptional regulator [Gammaproteobacteria bacterium]|nr:LysR family transcriptional regulator [Gammaproteobacteria bacterium]
MDRFENLHTFVKVVDFGGISAAAEHLNIAKSAVSRRITELEQRLGVQLFRRTTRQLNLTDSGKSFYERAVRILTDLEEAELAISQQHGELAGPLKIAAPLSFGLRHLTPAITDFMKNHPKLQFDLDFNDRHVDILQEGFDLAIRISRLGDSSFIARPLATVHHMVCASPEYLQRRGTPSTPDALIHHHCLSYSNVPDSDIWRFTDPDSQPGQIKIPVALRANNGDFLRDAAIAGLGVILEPTFIVYDAVNKGQLTPLLTGYQWPIINAYAVYPHTRHLSQRVRAFVDFLAQRFTGTPYWDLIAPR